jgi:undecaprenyl pyrophosphate synthase
MSNESLVPIHVAVIMDGNGRWAKERGLDRTEGHRNGIKPVQIITRISAKQGIKFLTLFAFSTENWKREAKEVNFLFHLFVLLLGKTHEITEEVFKQFLYTKDQPDPDLIIRTGGEKRLSNFLLYQSAYSELFFTDTLWPDFTEREFLQILQEFSKRVRKYGALK